MAPPLSIPPSATPHQTNVCTHASTLTVLASGEGSASMSMPWICVVFSPTAMAHPRKTYLRADP
eukprot:14162466-Alexandrium_andersonii.AAC.1